MNNKEYVDLVNNGQYPEDITVPLDKPFEDERGVIQNLWLGTSGSLTLITSKKGSIRAKHHHTNDWHAMYVISGKFKYTEKPDIEKVYSVGEMVFTKPGVYHVVEFLEDSIVITINNIVKNHENYEKDVVRDSK